MTEVTKPKRKSALKLRLERRARAMDGIIKAYNESAEAKTLDARSTKELVEMDNKDSEWLRRPCGDLNIDAGLLARSMIVSKILKARGVRFAEGRYQL